MSVLADLSLRYLKGKLKLSQIGSGQISRMIQSIAREAQMLAAATKKAPTLKMVQTAMRMLNIK